MTDDKPPQFPLTAHVDIEQVKCASTSPLYGIHATRQEVILDAAYAKFDLGPSKIRIPIDPILTAIARTAPPGSCPEYLERAWQEIKTLTQYNEEFAAKHEGDLAKFNALNEALGGLKQIEQEEII